MNKGFSNVIKYSGVAALVLALVSMSMNMCCKKSGTVGVLDNERILTTATSFQVILGEEGKYLNALKSRQAEDEKMLQAELVALQQKIKSSGKPENAFQKEVNEFRQKVIFYNQKYQIQRSLIAQASQAARQQLDPFVREVLNELSKEGYTVILPKQNVTYSAPSADVTAEFIKRLDAKKINISFPDPAQLAVAQAAQAQVNAPVANAEQVKPAETKPAETKPAETKVEKKPEGAKQTAEKAPVKPKQNNNKTRR